MSSEGAPEPVYEFAIVGAGVSGLCLAWLLGESSLAERPILLVDGARDDDELRTLSFWSPGPMALEALVKHRWSTLRLHVGGTAHDVPITEHTYRTFFFADLQRETKARLAKRPGNRVVEGRLTELVQDADGATLTVGDATFRARWVFDSRFRRKDLEVDPRRWHLLEQHFHGSIVRADRDVFEPSVATLLDFRVETPPGTGFFYVLPFSKREGLVELVTLEGVDAEPMLRRYLARVFGIEAAELVEREAGVSPMTEQRFDWRDGARVRRLGIAAGRLKASTGYALTRITDDCASIVRSLDRRASPSSRRPARGSTASSTRCCSRSGPPPRRRSRRSSAPCSCAIRRIASCASSMSARRWSRCCGSSSRCRSCPSCAPSFGGGGDG